MAEKYGFDFEIGDMVYLKTDMEQHSRIVTGINIRENGILFCLMFTTTESWHYGFELTKERDVIKATS